jgi:glucose/arabinose dehydrogenase
MFAPFASAGQANVPDWRPAATARCGLCVQPERSIGAPMRTQPFRRPEIVALGATALLLGACGDTAQLPLSAGFGPTPALPEPHPTLLPTIEVARAVGWPNGLAPVAAPDLSVVAYARGLLHPRWLYVLPNGDVLAAETDAPERPELESGIRGHVTMHVMRRSGSAGPSPDRITLLRDEDGDGRAETQTTLLEHLHSPFGMALVGNQLFVADTDAVLRFPYADGEMQVSEPGVKLVDLPAGPLNYHWAKNIVASVDGSRLYVTVGSNSNVAEHGLAREVERAAVWEVETETGRHRVFASGLRNPSGLAWEPVSGRLWTTVNERDEIGSDLVPDYMTSLSDGGFYGWPYSYYGPHVDARVQPRRPDLVAQAIVPDYALGAHTASLGLAFSEVGALSVEFAEGAFIGQHGSWNRSPRSGFKVIFVPFTDGKPSGEPVDVLTGFVNDNGEAYGRPVGVALDRHGALLVADDVGGVVWRVTAATNSAE